MSITSETDLREVADEIKLPLNGIFNKDEIPSRIRKGAYIINLEDSKSSSGQWNEGSHWVGLWIEPPYGVYFDPFGISPPAQIQLFIHSLDEMWSNVQIQNEYSGWCGYYTLSFLLYMSRNRGGIKERFHKFLQLWSKNPKENLTRLKHYMRAVLKE